MRAALAGLLALVLVPGCVAPAMMAPAVIVPAGASVLELGSSAWTKGKLEVVELAPYEEVTACTRRVLEQLKFEGLRSKESEKSVVLSARDQAARTIYIRVARVTPTLTQLSIRVGMFGDQPLSILIHQQISACLQPEPMDPGEP